MSGYSSKAISRQNEDQESKYSLHSTLQVTDENYEFKSVLRRMKNIDNLKIFPIETDTIVDWSPAREVFKILGEEIEGSIWNHIHLSRILRLVERTQSSELSQ